MNRLLVWAFLFLICSGCAKPYHSFISRYNFENKTSIPDYSRLDYWAAHPWKYDPSDSTPLPLMNEIKDSVADVFFIHPTTYTRKRTAWNADINNNDLNAKTDYTSILYQSSVFNQHCRVFAPRYRQVHLSAFFTEDSEALKAFDVAYEDVRNAFQYYLQHFNKGRPIIVAGHSQGALLSEKLLKEFFENKPLQKQLVVAYIAGWPVFAQTLREIPVCTSPEQTGCFCTWRTFKNNYVSKYVQKETTRSFVTNPLSWDTTSTYIDRNMNRGSVLRNFNKVIEKTNGAKVHNGVLWISKPKFPGSVFFLTRNYHIGDINLFYINLRTNVEQRINAYLKK